MCMMNNIICNYMCQKYSIFAFCLIDFIKKLYDTTLQINIAYVFVENIIKVCICKNNIASFTHSE